MRIGAFLRILALGTSAAVLFGCSESDSGGKPAPQFQPNQGQPANGTLAYPAGPYGISKGSVIANYEFVGFMNAQAYVDSMQFIQLADFYNPTGTEVFPEGSLYGSGEPKPKALLINVSSVWCPPCNYEAEFVLPELYAKFQPMGGEFLLDLADGPTPGIAATPTQLYYWTKKYSVDYPAALDPSYRLSALFESDAFPANLIIKTQNMTIVEVISGAPEPGSPTGDAFWATYESVILGEL